MSRAEFYRLVSDAILRTIESYGTDWETADGARAVARELARAFARHNSKFDTDRFFRDCGMV